MVLFYRTACTEYAAYLCIVFPAEQQLAFCADGFHACAVVRADRIVWCAMPRDGLQKKFWACYIPYVAIAFAALALNEGYFKAQTDRKKFWLVVSVLLALVAGLGGPREIIALYVPLGLAAAAELVRERNNETKRQQFIYAAFVGASALIGYALNRLVLARIYTFLTWGGLSFKLADGARNLLFIPDAVWGSKGNCRQYISVCPERCMDRVDHRMHRVCLYP